eukprot:m.227134 g.227134  ORF g.227134 m.227134 type:complete len:310 (+) comp19223_c0_seq2:695-1624(+)
MNTRDRSTVFPGGKDGRKSGVVYTFKPRMDKAAPNRHVATLKVTVSIPISKRACRFFATYQIASKTPLAHAHAAPMMIAPTTPEETAPFSAVTNRLWPIIPNPNANKTAHTQLAHKCKSKFASKKRSNSTRDACCVERDVSSTHDVSAGLVVSIEAMKSSYVEPETTERSNSKANPTYRNGNRAADSNTLSRPMPTTSFNPHNAANIAGMYLCCENILVSRLFNYYQCHVTVVMTDDSVLAEQPDAGLPRCPTSTTNTLIEVLTITMILGRTTSNIHRSVPLSRRRSVRISRSKLWPTIIGRTTTSKIH